MVVVVSSACYSFSFATYYFWMNRRWKKNETTRDLKWKYVNHKRKNCANDILSSWTKERTDTFKNENTAADMSCFMRRKENLLNTESYRCKYNSKKYLTIWIYIWLFWMYQKIDWLLLYFLHLILRCVFSINCGEMKIVGR